MFFLRSDLVRATYAGIISFAVAFTPYALAGDTSELSQQVSVGLDGAVHVPAYEMPLSTFMSKEAKQAYIDMRLKWPSNVQPSSDRRTMDTWIAPLLKRARDAYAVTIEEKRIGGVPAAIVMPQSGIAPQNTDRILISLHGGGFFTGEGLAQLLEATPIAAIGRIQVISITFRQGPEHRFPAASEDVAAVYKELLKKYKPQNIGLYGNSTGGTLVAMSLAWFQQEKLPTPGAIALISAPISSGGDSFYSATPLFPLFGKRAASPPVTQSPVYRPKYLAEADFSSPLVTPEKNREVLSKFPPTLIITGTRDQLASGLIHTHRELVRVDVDSQLEIWEGMWHSFVGDPHLPESKEAFEVMTKFFSSHLGRPSR